MSWVKDQANERHGAATPRHGDSVPWKFFASATLKWINAFSLDAVSIGFVWLSVFTWQFCGRAPASHETATICLSIWLVYVADRLLDSLNIDLSRPHAFRHRLHAVYRIPMLAIWLVGLCASLWVIVRFASDSQLRFGIVTVGAVIGYMILVQFRRNSPRWFHKELVAGLIFSFGISLIAWVELCDSLSASSSELHYQGWINLSDLALLCLLCGMVFGMNCILVSRWEEEFDRSQSVASSTIRFPEFAQWIPRLLMVIVGCCFVRMFWRGEFDAVSSSIASSAALMITVFVLDAKMAHWDSDWFNESDQRTLLVFATDVSVLIPPAVILGFAL